MICVCVGAFGRQFCWHFDKKTSSHLKVMVWYVEFLVFFCREMTGKGKEPSCKILVNIQQGCQIQNTCSWCPNMKTPPHRFRTKTVQVLRHEISHFLSKLHFKKRGRKYPCVHHEPWFFIDFFAFFSWFFRKVSTFEISSGKVWKTSPCWAPSDVSRIGSWRGEWVVSI